MRSFLLLTLVIASVAWLIPFPHEYTQVRLAASAAVWICVWFLTLPRPNVAKPMNGEGN